MDMVSYQLIFFFTFVASELFEKKKPTIISSRHKLVVNNLKIYNYYELFLFVLPFLFIIYPR